MKKILEKVTTIALAVISILFIALIWVIMFKPDISASMVDDLVRAFVIILSSAFVILTALNIYSAFVDNERLSDVLLFKDRESATRATVAVVKKTAKRITKNMDDAKIKKVTLYSDASGNISMNVEIKVKSDETLNVVTLVRALLINTFDEIFGIEFLSINFRVISSKNKFVPKDADIKAKVEELKESLVANKPEPGFVQTSKISGDIKEGSLVEAKDDAKESKETTEAEATEEELGDKLVKIQEEENAGEATQDELSDKLVKSQEEENEAEATQDELSDKLVKSQEEENEAEATQDELSDKLAEIQEEENEAEDKVLEDKAEKLEKQKEDDAAEELVLEEKTEKLEKQEDDNATESALIEEETETETKEADSNKETN